jgi:hypothetical protein
VDLAAGVPRQGCKGKTDILLNGITLGSVRNFVCEPVVAISQ